MKKLRRISAIGAVIILGGLALWFLGVDEPKYQGRRASEWLDVIAAGPDQQTEARNAFQMMGKEAVPFLTSIVGRKETKFGVSYERFYSLLPTFLRDRMPSPSDLINQKLRASIALMEIGTNAVEALPSLFKAVDSENPGLKSNLLIAIALIAPGSQYELEAVKTLIKFKENWRLEDFIQSVFGRFPNQTHLTLPVLIEGLAKTPTESIKSLKMLGPSASNAIPQLEDLMKTTTSSALRADVSNALLVIRGNR